MLSKAPKVADNNWESMGKVSDWFKRNKIEIDMRANDKQTDCTSFPIWWIHLMAVVDFSRVTNTTFKILQGPPCHCHNEADTSCVYADVSVA